MRDFRYLFMIFKTDDCSDVLGRLERLEFSENQKCLEVSTNSGGANIQVRIRNRVRLTDKDLILLWELREAFPALTRLFIEDTYERRISRKTPRQLSLEEFRDKLYLSRTSNWKVGRILKRLIELLEGFRVYQYQPPRPKKQARLRTPSAAGGRSKSFGSSVKIELDSYDCWKEEQHIQYLKSQAEDLQRATRLLAQERNEKYKEKDVRPRTGELNAQVEKLPSDVSNEAKSENEFDRCALLEGASDKESVKKVERPLRCSLCPQTTRLSCKSYCQIHH